MRNIKGAIFDVDGTLLDSMPGWDNASYDFLKSRSVKPKPDLNESLRDVGGHQVPDFFRKEYGIKESEEEIRAAINGMLEVFYRDTAPLKEGVLEVLETLNERGVKMCVVTATDGYLVKPALERCGILHYFSRVFSCGEEALSKREPEIFLRAAAFLNTPISETVVFEDALYAIKTAKKAGFPVAAVYDLSEHEYQDEIRSLADFYFESLRSFGDYF